MVSCGDGEGWRQTRARSPVENRAPSLPGRGADLGDWWPEQARRRQGGCGEEFRPGTHAHKQEGRVETPGRNRPDGQAYRGGGRKIVQLESGVVEEEMGLVVWLRGTRIIVFWGGGSQREQSEKHRSQKGKKLVVVNKGFETGRKKKSVIDHTISLHTRGFSHKTRVLCGPSCHSCH